MKQIKWLESLRGIGCLIVLFAHIIASDPQIGKYASGCGKIGVWLFMLITGFLVVYTTSEKPLKLLNILQYYEKRIARLYPSLLLSIILAWTFSVVTTQDIFDMLLFRSAWGHFWYMSAILKFCLIAPVFFVAIQAIKQHCSDKQYYVFCSLFLIILIALDSVLFPYTQYPENSIEIQWYLAVLITGMLLAILKPVIEKRQNHWMYILTLIGIGMILIRTPLARELLWGYPPSGYLQNKYLYMTAAWSLIIVGIMGGKRIRNLLERSIILQKTGKISYEIYLVHYLVLNVVSRTTTSLLIKGAMTIVISIVIAILFNLLMRLFEKKINIHKRLAIILTAFFLICFGTGVASAENEKERLYVPTMITKADNDYFIVDCWHHRVIYSDSLSKPVSEWNQLTDERYIGGHTVSTDGDLLVLDNTDQSQVLVYKKQSGRYQLQQVFENIPGRPHFSLYDESNQLFYVISSTQTKIYAFRNGNGILKLERVEEMPELIGSYVRSISIIEGDLYTASGPNAICRYRIYSDHFEFLEQYPVPESIMGMNQITKIGEFYYTVPINLTYI